MPVTTAGGDAVASIGAHHARVYEWVNLGLPVKAPVRPKVAAPVGRLLSTLHGLALPADGPVDPWYTRPPAPETWDRLAERARAAGAAWAGGLASARPRLAELAALIVAAPGRPILVCHRDFTPDNVRPRRPDRRLIVLDWENAGPLHPEQELGSALMAWCGGRGRFDAVAAQTLLDGYAAGAGSVPPLGAGLFDMAIAVQLNFLETMAGQALDDPEHRRYAEGQIASMLKHDVDDLLRSIDLAVKALDLAG
jgi:aminoglycoside phosphotransferase (APT) family kinase protein